MTTEQAEASGARRGRPPESEEQRERRRLAISRHAVRLFREQGVTETTGEQIAHAAGVSERTLWRLFRAKEACVEPVLTTSLDDFVAVLRSWPEHLELDEHLRSVYAVDLTPSDAGTVLAVVRLTRDEPGLRAVWLVLHERAEPTIAAALATRLGLPVDDLDVRLRAAAVNAALRVLTDELAWAVADAEVTTAALERHRDRLAETLRTLTRRPGGAR
ncbi:TetR/AcrR family transcriptional regulator [Actinomycetospora endophytica]|uniref:TetR/AcrR family transcriptional regulator n=1 Tax=Actinomycetospora endophytica TaxID=2291215 RepID=A0ABS8PEQ5_9PSEU|nr:TetR/AcrR family transcriptional regulator [Actinomycetospora endophytica]MCD2196639.1 TetR/AcrR family transcriptional regulator [Actinomycetospora endophytica]